MVGGCISQGRLVTQAEGQLNKQYNEPFCTTSHFCFHYTIWYTTFYDGVSTPVCKRSFVCVYVFLFVCFFDGAGGRDLSLMRDFVGLLTRLDTNGMVSDRVG